MCGAQRRKPASKQQKSEYYRNITMNWKFSRKMEMKGRQQLYKVIKYHSDPFLFQQYFRVPMFS